MTKDEALKLARKALEAYRPVIVKRYGLTYSVGDNAITAIQETLAEPEQNQFNPDWDAMAVMVEEQQRMAKRIAELEAQQEPVAWATRMGEYAHIKWGAKRPEYPMVYEIPLYTTPPQRKPLTDEEIVKITSDPCLYIRGGDYRIDIARAIEAAHGIGEKPDAA